MKRRMKRLAMSLSALAIGTVAAISLAIPAGVFADAQPLVGGVIGTIARPNLVSDNPRYYGYANVSQCGYQSFAACTVVAWQWRGSYGWRQTNRYAGERVYVWPYASGWSWTWTSDRGWLAMRSDKLVIGMRDDPPIIVT